MEHCKICGKRMLDIEMASYNYETFVCITFNCPEYGKAQVHKQKKVKER